jgi:hypothetical protein
MGLRMFLAKSLLNVEPARLDMVQKSKFDSS